MLVIAMLILTIFAVAIPTNVSANPGPLYVGPSYDPSIPGYFNTIQDAVNAAAPGDTIYVDDGFGGISTSYVIVHIQNPILIQ